MIFYAYFMILCRLLREFILHAREHGFKNVR
jgi:hypothetical protein